MFFLAGPLLSASDVTNSIMLWFSRGRTIHLFSKVAPVVQFVPGTKYFVNYHLCLCIQSQCTCCGLRCLGGTWGCKTAAVWTTLPVAADEDTTNGTTRSRWRIHPQCEARSVQSRGSIAPRPRERTCTFHGST